VFRLPLARLSWEELETLTTSRGLVRYCAEPTAPDAVGADVAVSSAAGVCLVLGSEGQGLSETALRTCRPVAIPMPGEMESLNVGIAGGILMYLMRKER
jgi:TrmH family RNA methyltransferase